MAICRSNRTRRGADLKGERLRENGWIEQEHGVVDAGGLGGEFRGRPRPVWPLVQGTVGRLSGPVAVAADQDRRTSGPVFDSRELPAVDELAFDRIPGAEELPAVTEGQLIDGAGSDLPEHVLRADAPFALGVVLIGIGLAGRTKVVDRRGSIVVLLAVGQRVGEAEALGGSLLRAEGKAVVKRGRVGLAEGTDSVVLREAVLQLTQADR